VGGNPQPANMRARQAIHRVNGGWDMSRYATFLKFALAVGVLVLAAGCEGKKEVAIANKDATIRKQDELIAQERADKDQLTEANKGLSDQNRQLAENNARIARDNAAQVAALNQKVDGLQTLVQGIDGKMTVVRQGEGVPNGGDLAARKDGDGTIHILVANTTLFDSGNADLKSSSHAMLEKVCRTIKAKYPNNCIRVEGHTDSTPVVHNKSKYPDNMALSVARARAVYDFMSKDGGIAASKMYMAGYGQFQPLVHPEKTAADRSKNRRVEIVIMPDTVKVQKEQLADAKPAAASTTARKK
jgi:chemotaxis protein MotB